MGPTALSAHADTNAAIGLSNEGVKAMNAGNYPLAIQKFEAVLQLDKSYQLARENLAIVLNNYGLQLAKKNPQQALKQFHQASYLTRTNATTVQNIEGIIKMLGKNPRDFKTRVDIAEQCRIRGDFIGAIVEYTEALKIKDDAKTHIKLGDCYRVKDNVDDAIKEYQAAARLGDSCEVEVKLGQALQAKGDLPMAIIAFSKALAFDPTDADTLDAMQAAWEDALRKDPLAPDNHIGLGQALQLKEDFGNAAAEYKQAIQLSKGNNPTAQKLLAALPDLIRKATIKKHINNGFDLQEKKLYMPAIEEYKLALEAEPENTAAFMGIDTCKRLVEQKEVGQPLEPSQKIVAQSGIEQPKNSMLTGDNSNDINHLVAQKRYLEASQILDRVLKAAPTDAKAWFNYGICSQALEDYHGALAAYEMCKTLNPSDSQSIAAAEQVRMYLKKQEDAKRLLAEEALARQKQRTELQRLIAQNEYAQAAGIIDKLLKTEPKDADLWFSLGTAKQGLGDNHAALAAYEMASRLSPNDEKAKTALLKIRSFVFSGETGVLKPTTEVSKTTQLPDANNNPGGRPSVAAQADVDFGPFMADLQRRIKRQWFPVKGKSDQVALKFKIHRRGELSDLRLTMPSFASLNRRSPSLHNLTDLRALDAVKKASPFRPLPAGSPDCVNVSLTFNYCNQLPLEPNTLEIHIESP